jgi:hypothetical protein
LTARATAAAAAAKTRAAPRGLGAPAIDQIVSSKPSRPGWRREIPDVAESKVMRTTDARAASEVRSGQRMRAGARPAARKGSAGAKKRGPGEAPPNGR